MLRHCCGPASMGPRGFLERATGIEPVSLAWKARVLPLHNARDTTREVIAATRQGKAEIPFPGFAGPRARANSNLIERGRPLSFLIVSRIFFDQPVSAWSENTPEDRAAPVLVHHERAPASRIARWRRIFGVSLYASLTQGNDFRKRARIIEVAAGNISARKYDIGSRDFVDRGVFRKSRCTINFKVNLCCGRKKEWKTTTACNVGAIYDVTLFGQAIFFQDWPGDPGLTDRQAGVREGRERILELPGDRGTCLGIELRRQIGEFRPAGRLAAGCEAGDRHRKRD
jgi:hypothetical protein